MYCDCRGSGGGGDAANVFGEGIFVYMKEVLGHTETDPPDAAFGTPLMPRCRDMLSGERDIEQDSGAAWLSWCPTLKM